MAEQPLKPWATRVHALPAMAAACGRCFLSLLPALLPGYCVHALTNDCSSPVWEEHGLFGESGPTRVVEQRAIDAVDVDAEGGRMWQMFMVWSLQIVDRQFHSGAITPPVHAQLNKLILDMADSTCVCARLTLDLWTTLLSR